MFTRMDRRLIRTALMKLNQEDRQVILMRFWWRNTLDEIARILNVRTLELETRLSQILAKLRSLYLQDKTHSI